MENVVHQRGWHMVLQAFNDKFFRPPGSRQMVAMHWKKVSPNYNRIAELENMDREMIWNMGWHPSVQELESSGGSGGEG